MPVLIDAIIELPELIDLTKTCRKSWEEFLRTKRNGITEEMRRELDAMKDVISRLVHEELVSDFNKLSGQWEQERPRGSDVLEMIMHPSYQRIIGMGHDVVPLLLKELDRKPEHWFWALHAITGADPVPPESQGNLKQMAASWVTWGKQQGYKW
jgi:hypothetical protein